MLKRVLNFFRLDTALSLRDSITVYSLISPVVLALVLVLVIPGVEQATITIAVHRNVGEQVIQQLDSYGKVEVYTDEKNIIERVNRNDDVAGLYRRAGEFHLVLEGNEAAEAAEGFSAIVKDATGPFDGVVFAVEDLKGQPAPVLEYTAVMMIMLSLMIGGIIVGFNIVDEKESGVIRAMAVSPLRLHEFIIARSVLALIIGCVAGLLSAVILLGWDINFVRLTGSMLLSLFVALSFGFIIGAFTDNQMSAFALIKLLMALFLTPPLVSIFVPSNWQWLFYILPNYWMFLTISHSLVGSVHGTYGLSALLTIVSGLLIMGLLFPKLKKTLGLR